MAKTLNSPINKSLSPFQVAEIHGIRIEKALLALNYFRMGNLEAAIRSLHPDISLADVPKIRKCWRTPKDWASFYKNTRKVIEWLKSVGI